MSGTSVQYSSCQSHDAASLTLSSSRAHSFRGHVGPVGGQMVDPPSMNRPRRNSSWSLIGRVHSMILADTRFRRCGIGLAIVKMGQSQPQRLSLSQNRDLLPYPLSTHMPLCITGRYRTLVQPHLPIQGRPQGRFLAPSHLFPHQLPQLHLPSPAHEAFRTRVMHALQ